MLLKSFSFRLIAVLAITLTLGLVVFADTIRLKDGSIVKGTVVGFKNGQFVIVIGEGTRQRQMSFYADEIEAIEFDSKTSTPVNVSQPRPTPTPIASNTNPSNSNPNVKVVEQNKPAETVPVSTPKTTQSTGIQVNVKVLADNTSNGWTNSGWVVKKGQKIRISGTGRISLGNGRYATPSGVASLPDNDKLVKDKPTGGIIAVIGDDNNEFIFIGGAMEFVAKRDGALFLGINEGYLDDNSGSFDVVIEIDPVSTSGN